MRPRMLPPRRSCGRRRNSDDFYSITYMIRSLIHSSRKMMKIIQMTSPDREDFEKPKKIASKGIAKKTNPRKKPSPPVIDRHCEDNLAVVCLQRLMSEEDQREPSYTDPSEGGQMNNDLKAKYIPSPSSSNSQVDWKISGSNDSKILIHNVIRLLNQK